MLTKKKSMYEEYKENEKKDTTPMNMKRKRHMEK